MLRLHGEMVNAGCVADSGPGVLEFITNSVQGRAAHYQERAAHLRGMAETEPVGRLRNKLIELAYQFETLADSLAIQPRA
jgi:hypothetical protein